MVHYPIGNPPDTGGDFPRTVVYRKEDLYGPTLDELGDGFRGLNPSGAGRPVAAREPRPRLGQSTQMHNEALLDIRLRVG
jgi:hypothetical protein